MRRQDITLRRTARLGDAHAQLELAKRYLNGDHGFPRHVDLGLKYVADRRSEPIAALLVARSLSLQELASHGQLDLLPLTHAEDCKVAAKWGLWQIASGAPEAGLKTLRDALGTVAQPIQVAWTLAPPSLRLTAALRAASEALGFDGAAVGLAAARIQLERGSITNATLALRAAIEIGGASTATHALVTKLLKLAEQSGQKIDNLSPQNIHDSLESRCSESDDWAWFTLGRALCNIPCGPNDASSIVRRENLRRGAALLVRAGDSGIAEAWGHLYRIHSNARCSVANPELARFYLEKAALNGDKESQRRLGALMLRDSCSLRTSQQAVEWLYRAFQQGDSHAEKLLRSLVLPVHGSADDAEAAIQRVEEHAPWLAARLRIARDFGLTRLEALSIDPTGCARAWGLVTGDNPFITQSRLAAPRAVPATSAGALESLRRASTLFATLGVRGILEGNLKRRSAVLRQLFLQLGIEDDLFFAEADSSMRDRLRIGTRWAHHMRLPLQEALD